MRNFLDNSIRVDNSKPPLRWIANWAGSIAGSAIMRVSYAEEYEKNYGIRYKFNGWLWDTLWPIYSKYGTFYKLDMDMSGAGWDDYDADGIPYWEKWEEWDFVDEETDDAFRIIYKSGYGSIEKLTDDDYKGPITPFLGDNK